MNPLHEAIRELIKHCCITAIMNGRDWSRENRDSSIKPEEMEKIEKLVDMLCQQWRISSRQQEK